MNEFFPPPPPPPPPPPFPPRSISLPPTSPTQIPEPRTFGENHEYSSLINQYLSPIVERDAQIRALSSQLHSQQCISTKQEEQLEHLRGVVQGKDRELQEKERDLKQSQEVNREHRVEFGKLRADFWAKERGVEGLKGTVERLEREKVELNVSAGEPFAKRIVELEAANKEAKGRIEVLERKEECLAKEVKEVREGLTRRDRDIEILKKEKKADTAEKEKLVEERDEAHEEEVALLRKIQGLEIAKQKLDELVAQQQGTMADRQRQIDRLECDVRRVKAERDNYIDKANGFEKEKEEMECKVNKLEGKISQMVHIGTSDGVDEEGPSAKRPRTPQSAKRDSIPSCPRAMAAGSPDTPKSMSICSPTDGRNSRLPGNEVVPTQQRFTSNQHSYPDNMKEPAKGKHSPSRVSNTERSLNTLLPERKIVTLKLPGVHLRKFPSSRDAVKMNPDSAPFPKPLEEIEKLIEKLIKRPHHFYSIGASLKAIRAALNLEHERHGEILKEKEDKIWALQNRLQAECTEKDQLQRDIEKVKAEKHDKIWTLQNQLQAERTEKDQLQRDIEKVKAEIQKTLRTSSEARCSMLEKEIKELKEKGKRVASALMSTAKELELEAPPLKKTKT
ncbi:hypothetical protein F5882DRAFT_505763 [Hyaloscypha sp. PMI_1271]|nr:hypothetical protein F5882DRAFT_505763 [Hyaloscypha sp. PMI_1271]